MYIRSISSGCIMSIRGWFVAFCFSVRIHSVASVKGPLCRIQLIATIWIIPYLALSFQAWITMYGGCKVPIVYFRIQAFTLPCYFLYSKKYFTYLGSPSFYPAPANTVSSPAFFLIVLPMPPSRFTLPLVKNLKYRRCSREVRPFWATVAAHCGGSVKEDPLPT